MGDHDMVADFYSEQASLVWQELLRIDDDLAQYPAAGRKNIGKPPRQLGEVNRARQQRIEPGIGKKGQGSGEPAAMGPSWPP
jgi:hypothetical protein